MENQKGLKSFGKSSLKALSCKFPQLICKQDSYWNKLENGEFIFRIIIRDVYQFCFIFIRICLFYFCIGWVGNTFKVYPVIREGCKDTCKDDDGIESFIDSDDIISAIEEAWFKLLRSNEENTKWNKFMLWSKQNSLQFFLHVKHFCTTLKCLDLLDKDIMV